MPYLRRLLSALVLSSCVSMPTPVDRHALEARAHALVAAENRSDADKALDPGRRPEAFLSALGIGAGMRVGELLAGGGYTTELLARAVEPGGVVYAENPKWVLERVAKPWAERLARPVNQHVVRVDRELDDPFPPDAIGTLDLVVTNANYHDTVWLEVDRDAMNRRVFAAQARRALRRHRHLGQAWARAR